MNTIDLPEKQVMYKALIDRNSAYEGVFIVGVKTTGIFCRPTCSARKPKESNVEFFATTEQALSLGYRPCKVCEPMLQEGEPPEWLKGLLKEVSLSPNIRLTDQDIKQRGLEPTRIRRWFKKYHGMTFQAYLRSLRINHAFNKIKHQDKVIDSALESGYESLSGFHEAFKKTVGTNPRNSALLQVITVTRISTPLGVMYAGANDRGICLLEFCDRVKLETQINHLCQSLKAKFMIGNHSFFQQLKQEMQLYFNGELQQFQVPLDIPGTKFQCEVWDQLQKIPYGETRTYQQQAERMNHPKAVRAVAKTNADNRIAIIIPCHRVIGKNGHLTGYAGGLWRKQRLLDLESGKKVFKVSCVKESE